MNSRPPLGLLLAALCFLGTSCRTVHELPELSVNMISARVEGATVFETSLRIQLRLQNDSAAPIAMEGAAHKIYFEGQLIGSGVSDEHVDVPRFNSVVQTVSVHFNNLAMLGRLRGVLDKDVVEYRVVSDFHARQADRSRRFQVTGEGWIDFREFDVRKPKPATPR